MEDGAGAGGEEPSVVWGRLVIVREKGWAFFFFFKKKGVEQRWD